MEFGLFDHLDSSGVPIHQLYSERLALIAHAESLGFTRYHIAEHHGTPLGLAPSPSLWIASVLQRTTTLRVGALAYVLPLYNPLRLAEEIAQLDQLGGGRLEVGVGRGASPYELELFGVDASTAFNYYVEALEAVTTALRAGHMSHTGPQLGTYDAPLEVVPLQRPYPPLWFPSANPQSATWAGQQGMNLATFASTEGFRPVVDEYWRSWQEHRSDPSRLNAHVSHPLIGVGRQIVIAATDDEAITMAREAHGTHSAHFLKLWHEHSDHSRDSLVDFERGLESGTILAGSAESVLERLSAEVEESGINYLMCTFAFGSLSHENAMHSMSAFAEDVMPTLVAIGARNPSKS